MPSLNKVMIMGNLGRDPELRYTPGGKAVTDLSLAIQDSRDKDAAPTWVTVTAWERTAETVCQYLRKGSCIHVEGRLTVEEWIDKVTGDKRNKMKVTAMHIQFLERKPRDEGSAPPRENVPQEGTSSYHKNLNDAANGNESGEEDIPF